jgi:hypothetical protein
MLGTSAILNIPIASQWLPVCLKMNNAFGLLVSYIPYALVFDSFIIDDPFDWQAYGKNSKKCVTTKAFRPSEPRT